MPCIYLLHRNPDVYEEPEAFRPERFLGRQPPPYAWIPFGGGVRRCLGAGFALAEMRAVMRDGAARIDLEPAAPAASASCAARSRCRPGAGRAALVALRRAERRA